MDIEIIIYLVKDGFGQTACAVCEDSSDTVQIAGLQNSGEETVFFESDAYHLPTWCDMQGFEIKQIHQTEDFETLWDK